MQHELHVCSFHKTGTMTTYLVKFCISSRLLIHFIVIRLSSVVIDDIITNICSYLVHILNYTSLKSLMCLIEQNLITIFFFHFLLMPSSSSSAPLSKEELIDFLIWFNFLYTFLTLIILKNTSYTRKRFHIGKKSYTILT